MYRHILIPTDGSELAQHGVAHGLALAKSLGARVSVIFVVEPFSEMTGRFLEAVATYAELRKEQATSALDRAAKAAKEAGVSCETIQLENGATPSSHHRSCRGQRLRSHCDVVARAQRTCRSSNRQCDKQGADARENPRTGLSVNVRKLTSCRTP
jgi:nucleotide-binding universal stress UspA family protein